MSDEAEPAEAATLPESTETATESTATTDAQTRDTPVGSALATIEHRLDDVRGDPRRRRVGTVAGVTVGLALVAVDPLGLLVGGAAVGVFQRDLPRALAAGLGFGALALVAFILQAPSLEAAELLAFSPVVYVTVGGALGLGLLGSLVRGVV